MRGVLPVLVLAFVLPSYIAQETTILPEPFEYPPCGLPDPVLFAQVGEDLENLEFDGNGSLFVTAFDAGLFRLDPSGNVTHVTASDRTRASTEGASNSVTTAFMGVSHGSDGALYVAEGHTLTAPVEGRILRFPEPGNATFEVFATGFPNTNGLASDGEGNLYLAHGFRDELWRVRPDGSWAVWTRVPDAVNGVVEHPDGLRLVIAPLGDGASAVYAIPLDEPEARDLLFRFNAGPSVLGQGLPDPGRPVHSKGIDDLAVAPDGRILITAHLRMQFVMGDPETGEACILLDGVRGEPSSIRVAEGFGEWDGWVFTTDFSGDVWAVDIRTGSADADTSTVTSLEREERGDEERAPSVAPVVALAVAMTVVAAASRRRAA